MLSLTFLTSQIFHVRLISQCCVVKYFTVNVDFNMKASVVKSVGSKSGLAKNDRADLSDAHNIG